MKQITKYLHLLLACASLILTASTHAKTIVVNTANNTDFSAGKTNLVTAINALKDGDTINFNIPGGGVKYITTPAGGYSFITNNNVTIGGYSQPGALANTHGIHEANNAQIKIVLDSRNGAGRPMGGPNGAASLTDSTTWGEVTDGGWGVGEVAILPLYRGTNIHIEGLAFLSAYDSSEPTGGTIKCVCIATDVTSALDMATFAGSASGWHISGCWFGVDPATGQVDLTGGSPNIGDIDIATYGCKQANASNTVYAVNGIIGVARNSTNPRAEFNVIVSGYGVDLQGGGHRYSGNFNNILPDGVTAADMSLVVGGSERFIEFGVCNDLVIGTDGDGINDADEANIFGPAQGGGRYLDFYSGTQSNIVMAGNSINADINGRSFGDNLAVIIHTLNNTSSARFGSDFNGVSDALEVNTVYGGARFVDFDNGSPTNTRWLSFRGNSLSNCVSWTLGTPPLGDGQTAAGGLNIFTNFIDVSGPNGTLDIIPVIDAGTTTTILTGTCGKPLGAPFTRLIVDIYVADSTSGAPPQGQKWLGSFTDNSAVDSNPTVGAFTFNLASLAIAHGTQVTIAVTYSSDTQPTIGPITRAGSHTTVGVRGSTGPVYGIQKSATVNGSYLLAAAAVGGSATFTDNNPASFYRATGPSATGQTSPFSALFTMP